MIRALFYIQGLYYFITGLWPLADIRSFMLITGEKIDIWLVKMVGLLTVSISLFLIYSGIKNKLNTEDLILIFGACLSYFIIDTFYAFSGRISRIYLADAVLQFIFIGLWIFVVVKQRSKGKKSLAV
jgi:hypothetical protein